MTNNNTTATSLVALPALPKIGRAPKPKTNECECGCGELTASTFVPGHDSRLRGWAIRLERGLVKAAAFPGLPGELKAAQAFLKANGGHVPAHAKATSDAASTTPNKGKRVAKKGAAARAEVSEQATGQRAGQ